MGRKLVHSKLVQQEHSRLVQVLERNKLVQVLERSKLVQVLEHSRFELALVQVHSMLVLELIRSKQVPVHSNQRPFRIHGHDRRCKRQRRWRGSSTGPKPKAKV
jgi:CRISPR/Cas system-associated endoribonuclease Cas2